MTRDRVVYAILGVLFIFSLLILALKFQIGDEALEQQIKIANEKIEGYDKRISVLEDTSVKLLSQAKSFEGSLAITSSTNNAGQASQSKNYASDSLFKLTTGTYAIASSNLNEAVRAEYGAGYRVADWNDIKSIFQKNTDLLKSWEDSIGLSDGGQALIFSGGQNYQGMASCGQRHYFIQRDDAPSSPGYFLVHDQLGNYDLLLGSWCDLTMKILAIKSVTK